MGSASSSDFVDPETLPLEILLAEEVGLEEQNVVDKRDDEVAKLRHENYQLRHETIYWREYSYALEFSGTVRLKSPLTTRAEKMYRADRQGIGWKWYKTNCPCCRRPLEITMSSTAEEPWTRCRHGSRGPRHAFVTALWGANAGYALGALVLGSHLQKLSPHIDRVIVHTDDVPSNYLEAFERERLWQLHKVDYIDGVPDLYIRKGNVFDGVFTKLAAWQLEEYDKVLLLDIDIIPLKPLDELFQLDCPAAMVRGQGRHSHGAEVDGSSFFASEDYQNYPWGQAGGINAGVILLQPDYHIFQQMLCEVTCKNHPCHVAGSGPEQDYLTRFFAAQKESPWHHISVAWNYQLHQSLFAIERALEWRAFSEKKGHGLSEEGKEDLEWWLPERLTLALEDIKVVHFSGEVKMWHRILTPSNTLESGDQRREVSHALASMNGEDDVAFAERLMTHQRGHALWISKTAEPKDYQFYGCKKDGQRILVGENEKDITPALDQMVQRVLEVAVKAAEVWHECYVELADPWPDLLDNLQKPSVPDGCFQLGSRVEVSWDMGQDSHGTLRWLPAHVLAVHDNKHYVVRYERRCDWGDWGDTERHVHPDRVKLLPTA